jgi:hypothetical protein
MLPILSHLANQGAIWIGLMGELTLLTGGEWPFAMFILCGFNLLRLPFNFYGCGFTDGLDSEPYEMYTYAFVWPLLGLGHSILIALITSTFNTPNLLDYRSISTSLNEKNKPVSSHFGTTLVIVLVATVAGYFGYDWTNQLDIIVPGNPPTCERKAALIGYLLVVVVAFAHYLLLWAYFRFLSTDNLPFTSKKHVDTGLGIPAIVNVVMLTIVTTINYFQNIMDWAWITAVVSLGVGAIVFILYWCIRTQKKRAAKKQANQKPNHQKQKTPII